MQTAPTAGSLLPASTAGTPGHNEPLPPQSVRRPSARVWVCCLAGAAGFLITLFCFYPGYMWWDSNNQLLQARNRGFTDWHPPLMSFTWAILDRIIPGPAGMLVFHNLMFWVGLALLVYLTRLPAYLAPVAILGVGLYPPIFVSLGVLLKDTGLAAALLLSYACLAYAYLRRSRLALVVGLGSLLYGFAVRHNAAAAIVPLSFLAAAAACRALPLRTTRPVAARLALAAAVLLSGVVLYSLGGRLLTRGQTLHPSHQILLHDLMAVSIRSGTIQLPAYILADIPTISIEDLEQMYTPQSTGIMFWGPGRPKTRAVITEAEYRSLVSMWIQVIPKDIHNYVAHRIVMFNLLLALGTPHVCDPYYVGPIEQSENRLGFSPAGVMLNAWLVEQLGRLGDSLVFRGWFYLALNACLLLGGLLFRRTHPLFVATLGLSGLCYVLAYLPLAAGCQLRMLWWPVLATVLLPLVALLPDRSPD